VVYQSCASPLVDVGRDGDLWVGNDVIYVKNSGAWTRLKKEGVVHCPYDPHLRLTWSSHAQFKYMAASSEYSERERWNKGWPVSLPKFFS
jgi:hypothetical protein